ncbi:uncharacterized protein LOC119662774 [Teleopsis dalmanni]|uniref:uncharacterized protein LOC119662774 n=1 Tax=Teleopsis dalmanni TaxID=139649 RepID=UPI0018CED129|nr:uncharacterized protein LOC119662774 [Teleopsis dalmanni]XP_037928451.1 uncharacterized protein LOC119662774 [Teleopsis dalmanni]XP_037928452.1 uncharacterized protein LOC119662774 [Teleopsis dalmanni]
MEEFRILNILRKRLYDYFSYGVNGKETQDFINGTINNIIFRLRGYEKLKLIKFAAYLKTITRSVKQRLRNNRRFKSRLSSASRNHMSRDRIDLLTEETIISEEELITQLNVFFIQELNTTISNPRHCNSKRLNGASVTRLSKSSPNINSSCENEAILKRSSSAPSIMEEVGLNTVDESLGVKVEIATIESRTLLPNVNDSIPEGEKRIQCSSAQIACNIVDEGADIVAVTDAKEKTMATIESTTSLPNLSDSISEDEQRIRCSSAPALLSQASFSSQHTIPMNPSSSEERIPPVPDNEEVVTPSHSNLIPSPAHNSSFNQVLSTLRRKILHIFDLIQRLFYLQ